MAILLPTLTQARVAARRAQCSAQLRQIGIAIAIYAGDGNDHLPFGSLDAAWPSFPNWPTWEDLLFPRLSTARPQVDYYLYEKFFYCPEGLRQMPWVQSVFVSKGYQTSYGFNRDLFMVATSPTTRTIRIEDLKRPARNAPLVCGGGNNFGIVRYDRLELAPNWAAHQGSANFVYLDGHVQALTRETVWDGVASVAATMLLRD